MKNIKPHFKFNKQERSGVFFLLLFIIILQGVYFYVKNGNVLFDSVVEVDRINQKQIDSLKNRALAKRDSLVLYPFNPNFISDYKGYTLGMSVDEIDRLHAYRELNKYANSAEEFQEITNVSDSLLAVISPRFKFPEWTQKSKEKALVGSVSAAKITSKRSIVKKDLNSVSAEELQGISGIGEKLSARIVKFRNRLGGFLVNEQLYDVYGLAPEVVQKVFQKYTIIDKPSVQKININTASASEISQLVYIPYKLGNEIVVYRENNGQINSFEELGNMQDFPIEKVSRIQLYLSLD